MIEKKKVLGFKDHSDINDALDYITSPEFDGIYEEGDDSEKDVIDYTKSDDEDEDEDEETADSKDQEEEKEEDVVNSKSSGHSLFFSEAIGALDLIKSIELSIEESQGKKGDLNPYFDELSSIVEETQSTYKGILETWGKLESMALGIKKSAPEKIKENPVIKKLKEDSEKLKAQKVKGEIDEEDFNRKKDVLRKKAIAELEPTEMVSLSEYSRASEYLSKAIEKFKKGAEVELKKIEEDKNRGKKFSEILGEMDSFIKAKRNIKTSGDKIKDMEKKDREETDRKEEKDKKENETRIKTM